MSTLKKCLIVDSMHESLFSMLTDIGWVYDYEPNITRDEIRKKVIGYDGLIVRSKTTIDRDLLGEAPTLKIIARAGAGIDNLDEVYLAEKGVHVVHAAEGNRDAVGEYAIGALLGLMRKLPKGDAEVRNLKWDREGNRGEEVMGKTVGLIGYGNMGHSFARRLSGFECKVLAYDKYKTNFSDAFAQEVSLETLMAEVDILSLHIPLTAETRGMVDESYLNRFQKRIIFMNTSRGEIVPLAGITAGLVSGKVRGAVLDVLENEKLSTLTPVQAQSFNQLRTRTDVIFTPHIAGWTYESHVKINVALTSKMKAMKLA
jgi:D-3-phosphoglycerate dehydrogenase / 2-oxoglutarate reductase